MLAIAPLQQGDTVISTANAAKSGNTDWSAAATAPTAREARRPKKFASGGSAKASSNRAYNLKFIQQYIVLFDKNTLRLSESRATPPNMPLVFALTRSKF